MRGAGVAVPLACCCAQGAWHGWLRSERRAQRPSRRGGRGLTRADRLPVGSMTGVAEHDSHAHPDLRVPVGDGRRRAPFGAGAVRLRRCARDRRHDRRRGPAADRFVTCPAGLSNRLIAISGSTDSTRSRHRPWPSPRAPSSPSPDSSCAAPSSRAAPAGIGTTIPTPGVSPRSSMPSIASAGIRVLESTRDLLISFSYTAMTERIGLKLKM